MANRILYSAIITIFYFINSGLDLSAQCAVGQTEIKITVTTDDQGYETYWELKENGVVVGSGGNPQVIPGAQQWTVDPKIPGAYAPNTTYSESVCVSDVGNVELVIMDDNGNGLSNGGYIVNIDGCERKVVDAHSYANEAHSFALPIAENDIKIESINFEKSVPGSSCLSGTMRNMGSNTITSFDLKWQVAGGNVHTRTFNNVNIPCNGTFVFTNDESLNMTAYGSKVDISLWTELPNNLADEDPIDNLMSASPMIEQGVVSYDKGVLMEQFVGAWNQFGPDGLYVADTLLARYPYKLFSTNVHIGDAMESLVGSQISNNWGAFFPGAIIDRFLFTGETDVIQFRQNWLDRIDQRLLEPTQVCVSVDCAYDIATRMLYAMVDVEVVDFMDSADYRIHVHLVEDGVTGTGSGYNQMNFYSNWPLNPNHPYFSLSNPIIGFVHDRVLRGSMVGSSGDATTLPSQPVPGVYSQTYAYSVPSNFDEENMYLIAFVEKTNVNVSKHEVLNVIKSKPGGSVNPCNTVTAPICKESADQTTVTPNMFPPKIVKLGGFKQQPLSPDEVSSPSTKFNIEVYPNPSSDKVYIRVNFDRSKNVTINLYDVYGLLAVTTGEMQSLKGLNKYFIDGNQLPTGMYHMVLTTNDGEVFSEDIIIAR